ncbi:MAG TPA: NnrU family protein [Azospirillum sp.]|nr:NnrU family protein [Azospirillum sp.]
MTGTLGGLAAAGAFLLITHFGISSTPLRGALVARVGEKRYLGLYALIAALAFVWLVWAYATAPTVPVWSYEPWQPWVPLLAMPVALLLIISGESTPNPTAVGRDALLEGADPARGILRITRNPFLWGIALWALAHLVPNGDAASVLLFGTMAVLALAGSVLIDAKLARRRPDAWARYAAVTSNVPFAAILAGRQRLVLSEFRWRLAVVVLVAFAAILLLHRWVIGVSPLPP